MPIVITSGHQLETLLHLIDPSITVHMDGTDIPAHDYALKVIDETKRAIAASQPPF